MLLATIQLGVLDSTVLVIYVVAMLLIGWYFARRTRDSEDYLLGGRRMNALVVGLSLFASLLSTISYLGYPAEMISHGPIILAGFIGYPVIVAVVGWVLIPAIMRWEVTTAYQILERRFHASVSVLASIIFLIIRLIWMALIISLMATKIIVPLLGIDPQGALWVSRGDRPDHRSLCLSRRPPGGCGDGCGADIDPLWRCSAGTSSLW